MNVTVQKQRRLQSARCAALEASMAAAEEHDACAPRSHRHHPENVLAVLHVGGSEREIHEWFGCPWLATSLPIYRSSFCFCVRQEPPAIGCVTLSSLTVSSYITLRPRFLGGAIKKKKKIKHPFLAQMTLVVTSCRWCGNIICRHF